ncbi:cyclase family protein [Aestuariivirga litoralis]|uniref:Cyclase family protein n=1 Tax=Aestuariivirga litoralis TaxID=2650924 RepID=A0A2W2ARN2_9HYPH|nr:cyclase family protein [Aestuariivirga litoralis]PZF78011.1 cyclase family protein [Aestuariivirga litoralis]
MCNACVIENVRQQAQSRRSFLARSAAAGAAALAASVVSARETLAQSSGKVVDLTHTFDENFPTFDGKPGIEMEKVVDFKTNGYTIYKLTIFEHSGTHIDAPLHFTADGTSVADLAPENLVCPLCILDIKARAKEDPNAMVTKADIDAWVSANGAIPKGACVAMNSGWSAKVGEPGYRTLPDGKFAFPGFSKEAVDLLAEAGAAAIAVDTLSLDPGSSQDFIVHNTWLPGGRYGIENVANLDLLPVKGATLFVGAPKHRGGTGGPARVMATF